VDPRSGEYTLVQEETSDRCYQYTWVGIQGRDQVGGVNGSGTFPSCETLEESFPTLYGRMIPCYEPTVYTYNNEYGTNRPNLSAIVEACNNQGCDPYCSRSGDSCVKYTVINNDDERSVEWESSFCGQVTTQWNGEVVSSGNCYTERDVSRSSQLSPILEVRKRLLSTWLVFLLDGSWLVVYANLHYFFLLVIRNVLEYGKMLKY